MTARVDTTGGKIPHINMREFDRKYKEWRKRRGFTATDEDGQFLYGGATRKNK